MSVLADFTIAPSEFVLADTLTVAPEMRIEIKRVVAEPEHVTPYFWASSGDFDEFEKALHDDESIAEMFTLEENGNGENDERFYRVKWKAQNPNIITAISEAEAAILEAVSSDGKNWELKVLFPSEDALSEFHDYCLEHGFSFQLERVYHPENPQERAEYGVTDEQQEALLAAYSAGYFDVPRGETLTAVADELGISRNALSARLRRGQRNLLANTLVHDK